MPSTVHIIDYGMGNLRSVQKALEKVGAGAVICRTPAEAAGADSLVLPGVGAFRDAIAELKRHDFVGLIKEHIAADRPFLGICLGLQLLFDVSYEDGEYEGLGIVPGEVVRFESQPGLKIPHMGWNTLTIRKPNPLLDGAGPSPSVYFVHSYYVKPRDPAVIAATAGHGVEFTAMIARGNLFATQFHPEKSQTQGLNLLGNFATLDSPVAR
ncbi:Imidazole glycerol phosphate synthase subunit HisH 1 [Caulifigura coniformis]|uniref:Imidazole glycerol phosphate synthase subunit HisH n=1 Tax=Caulifigura coniformis TaxID=2527983 RepID=A0A517S961_9PLAN|nr:imidazole glycerol phosphate synthase subunit HisH [Caulifigura coniformis]QDT52674.1 Imidazole glycerol phosphate synthase subunit HisH 1 [Caulifigura coniformis]